MSLKHVIRRDKFLSEAQASFAQTVLDFLKSLTRGTKFQDRVFLAGGAVRDGIMGRDIKDIDLLVDMPNGGIEFATWVCRTVGNYTEGSNPVVFPRFGTARFVLDGVKYRGQDLGGIEVECVMPRKEKYAEGSRKPEVSAGSLADDVERRDFTVNSLLKNLSSDEVLDLTGQGVRDIRAGVIRTPLDPDIIFSEDPLRMLRAIRFTVKYGWTLPLFMIRSIKRNASKLQDISAERVVGELNKMLVTDRPDTAVRLLQLTGLSAYIFPELDLLKGMTQGRYHVWDAATHTNMVLRNTPPRLITRLAGLFHDIGKGTTRAIIDGNVRFFGHEDVGADIARDIMTRLKYPNAIIEPVCAIISAHMRTKYGGHDASLISDKALRKLALDLGPYLEDTLDVIHADNIAHAADHNMPNQVPIIRDRLKSVMAGVQSKAKLPIDGHDIMKRLGISGGATVGVLLALVHDAWLEDPGLTREQALAIVDAGYQSAGG